MAIDDARLRIHRHEHLLGVFTFVVTVTDVRGNSTAVTGTFEANYCQIP
jgi:hypothetical protein